MINNKRGCFTLFLLAFTLFQSACAQVAPYTGKNYVAEQALVQSSTVLLNNEKYLIPLRNLTDLKVASVRFSNQYAAGFDSLLNKYTKVQTFDGNSYTGTKNLGFLSNDIKLYNTIIIQLNQTDLANQQIVNFIVNHQNIKNVVVAFFGPGAGLTNLNEVTAPILCTERVTPVSAYFAAQAIFGGVAITQKLTSTITQRYRFGMGFLTEKTRLQYTVPEDAGINSDNLQGIDQVAREAIAARATPGCVVLVAKDGKVIFNKAYGYHTYDNVLPDKVADIFDIASMTKISASTIEAMRLYEQGQLNLNGTMGEYLALARTSNKKDLTLRELLTHQAGLIPDIPTFDKVKPTDHSTDSSAAFPTKVNNGYFLRKDYFKDVMWQAMLNSPLRTRGQYVYSDVGMCFIQQIVETITSEPINGYVQEQFYTPLGMQTAGYLPLYRFAPNLIVPSETDEVYRKSTLYGYVNDPTAALMGGVAGHAGVFASANDVAILYQMLLNKGTYGGDQYFKPETVDLFAAKQSAVSRRGLGFDRWDPIAERHYPSQLASPDTYGHTGYTGTCVWVDPKSNLVYIFLSNRTYPTVSSKLTSLNIRPRIQDIVYQAIAKGLN
jgi:CubicO group peptidase (beta-lactamase class C family)